MKQAKTTKQPLEEDPIQKQADEFGEFWAGNNGSYDDLENNENEKEEFEEEKGKYSFGFYNGFKAALKNPTPIKEGLHTQNEKWAVHSTGSLPSKAEIHPANDPDGLIIIADVYKYEDAELIVRAVNERQALLDSNRELLKTLKELHGYAKQFKAYNTIQNSTHFRVANMIANGLHNKFNPGVENIGWAIVHCGSGEIWERKTFKTEKEAQLEYRHFNKKDREVWQLQSSETFYYQ